MGSTFTVVVIIGAAILACAAFGLALRLQTAAPRLRPAAPGRHSAERAAGGRQRLEGPVQVSNSHAAMRLGEPKTVSPSDAADKSASLRSASVRMAPLGVASLRSGLISRSRDPP